MKGPSRVRACAVVCALVGAVALSLLAATPVRAAWTQLTPKLTEPQAKMMAPKVANILRQGGDTKLVDQYFDQYYFPAMTASSPQGLAKIGDLRRNLFRQYLDTAQSADARAHLNELASKRMATIALGNYHPSVRYNAVLVMGQLTTEPPKAGAAPKPLPLATDMLLKLVELDEVKGVSIQSSVKVAALVGLERHALLGFDPKFADRMTKAALDVASRKDAPADTTAKVYDWMRGQAVRVLANQYAKGVTQPVADAIAALLANDKISVDQRCRIADSLKSDMFKGAKGVKLDSLVLALGKLASDSLDAESKKASRYEEKVASDPSVGFGGGGRGGGGYGGGRGGYGGGRGGYGGGGRGGFGGGFGEEDTGPKYEKRRALQRIMAVANASAAVLAGELGDDLKARVTELNAALMKVADQIVDKDRTDLEVTAAVIALSQQVNDMVAAWNGKAAPADGKAKANAFGAAG